MMKLNLEKMLYKRDKLSYSLVLIGLLLDVFYFFTLYKNNGQFYYDYKMGLSVLYNLIFMLIVFLSAEEIKNYHRNFSIVLMIVGALQIARIFIYPLQALNANSIPNKSFTFIVIYLVVSALCLIGGGIISFIKSTLLKKFKKESEGKE